MTTAGVHPGRNILLWPRSNWRMSEPSDFVPKMTAALHPKVTVDGHAHAYRVVTVVAVDAGEVLFRVNGSVTDRPSRYSIQIDERRHIDLAPDTPLDSMKVDATWRFLNHSCAPNAFLQGLDVVALRPIAQGEAVTYHYCTTEFDMAVPFECMCGHHQCLGTVRGFAHLPLTEQMRLQPWLAEHLRRRLNAAARTRV